LSHNSRPLAAGAAAGVAGGSFAISDGALVFTGIGFSWNPAGWAALAVLGILQILDLFGFDLFGGGGSTFVFIPGQWRRPHYVASQFIGSESVSPNMEDSFKYEAPMGGRVIWVSGPASSPPRACSECDRECANSGDRDLYACQAGDCCRSFGDNDLANCVRACLLNFNQSCSSWPVMKINVERHLT
jgi:hypothetical protein